MQEIKIYCTGIDRRRNKQCRKFLGKAGPTCIAQWYCPNQHCGHTMNEYRYVNDDPTELVGFRFVDTSKKIRYNYGNERSSDAAN